MLKLGTHIKLPVTECSSPFLWLVVGINTLSQNTQKYTYINSKDPQASERR